MKRIKKPVAQFSRETGNLVKIHDSIYRASKDTGIAQSNICSAAGGKLKSAGLYRWEYVKNKT